MLANSVQHGPTKQTSRLHVSGLVGASLEAGNSLVIPRPARYGTGGHKSTRLLYIYLELALTASCGDAMPSSSPLIGSQ